MAARLQVKLFVDVRLTLQLSKSSPPWITRAAKRHKKSTREVGNWTGASQ